VKDETFVKAEPEDAAMFGGLREIDSPVQQYLWRFFEHEKSLSSSSCCEAREGLILAIWVHLDIHMNRRL